MHDLADPEALAMGYGDFVELLRIVLVEDSARGQGGVAELGPLARLAAMRSKFADDSVCDDEYARFVGGMAFAGEAQVPDFATAVVAVEAVGRLCDLLTD